MEPPKEFIEIMFPGTDFQSVSEVQNNPTRALFMLQAEIFESFINSIASTKGEVQNIPYASMNFLIQRSMDPIRVAEIFVKMATFGQMVRKVE